MPWRYHLLFLASDILEYATPAAKAVAIAMPVPRSGSRFPALGEAGVVVTDVAFTTGEVIVLAVEVTEDVTLVEVVTFCCETVTVKFVDAALPYASVAVQVTFVVPIANVDPDACAHEGVSAVPYWSVAVGGV